MVANNNERLNEVLKSFADDFEERYNFFQKNGRGPNDHPVYGHSYGVYEGRARIALLAQGAPDLGEEAQNAAQTEWKNQIIENVSNNPEFVTDILKEEFSKGNQDAGRILRTQARFTLMNTEAGALGQIFQRVVGEAAGLFGHKHIRDQARNREQIRAEAQAFLDNTPE